MAWRDGERVRLFTRNGKDWRARYPQIVAAVSASCAPASSTARQCAATRTGSRCFGICAAAATTTACRAEATTTTNKPQAGSKAERHNAMCATASLGDI